MLSRLESLREQVAYLSEQLKAVMKRTKILEAEVKVFESEDKETIQAQSKSIKSEKLKKSASEPVINNHKGLVVHTNEQLQRLQMSQSRNSLKINSMAKALNHQVKHDLQFMEESRSLYDIEFEDSIMLILNGILKRRAEAVVRSLKSRKTLQSFSETGRKNPWGDEQVSGGKCDDVGITGLGLQNFLPTDKFNVIANYLSKPEIFTAVVEKLGLHC
jgi:hypothetical protein